MTSGEHQVWNAHMEILRRDAAPVSELAVRLARVVDEFGAAFRAMGVAASVAVKNMTDTLARYEKALQAKR